MSSFECKNSVFKMSNENNSFSITVPGHWQNKSAEKTVDELNNSLELRSLELHLLEVRKRSHVVKIGDSIYKLSGFDTFKEELLEELKKAKYNVLEDMVYRFHLTYDEIINLIDFKYAPTKRIGYSLNPGVFEVIVLNNTLKLISPDNVKVSVTIDDVRLKSNLKNNQTLIYTTKSFFYTMLGFTQSHQGPLNDFEGFYQILPGSYKSDRPINVTRIDKVHLKCHSIQGSIVNGIREPILFSYALSVPPGHKIFKEPRIKLFKKKKICSITYYVLF